MISISGPLKVKNDMSNTSAIECSNGASFGVWGSM